MTDCSSIRDRFFAQGPLAHDNPELAAHLEACPVCRQAARGLGPIDAALGEFPKLPVTIPAFESIAGAAQSAARSRRRVVQCRHALPFMLTGSAAAATAAALFAILAGHPPPVGPALARPGTVLSAKTGASLAVLASGARLRLDSGALRVAAAREGEEQLHLDAGALSLEVPKLPEGRALTVLTPDAEVRVHGTRFQVVRDATGTTVSVVEGLVEVTPQGHGRPATLIRAGESTAVEPLEGYRQRVRAAALAALDRGQMSKAEAELASLLATEPEVPMAAEAQALLAWASAATGDRRLAIERYGRALAMLPASEVPMWADNAFAERALLLEQESPALAAESWREYVLRFPDGLHVSLARARAAGEKRP